MRHLITLLGPTGIYILVSLLVTFLFYLLFVISFFGIPQTHAITFFYLTVLFKSVTLFGGFNKSCINNLSFTETKALLVKNRTELVEEFVKCTSIA